MSKEAKEGILAFEKEIELVSARNHVNIISLVGFCNELNEKILLYELMPNGSLYDYICKHKNSIARLTVEQRLNICIRVAKGLDYLHSRTDYVIIHSDLKTYNILLDQNLVPKISDFDLSRTRVAGPSTTKQITNHIQAIANIKMYEVVDQYLNNHS
ncbi:putative receptor-like protein kinase At5g39000 [Rutidosis leptorrhynchoides]|uniref:putative receptor-like protein kinase At5g39000 n=1 Tax=Rutidosis leptorrhynchoides TaxID=125765 RepID=UPI003A992DCD